MATYRHDYEATNRELLNADWMVAHMHELAERVATVARATAPVDSGEFAARFEVDSGKHGGVHHDRAYGRVANNDPAALSIEFGTVDTPAHLTLTRAIDSIR